MLPSSSTPESGAAALPASPEGRPAALDGLPSGAPSPFVRAHQFLERVGALTARDWQDVMRRAYAVETSTRRAAMHRVGEVLVGHPQTRAFDAIARAAHDIVHTAGRGRRLAADLVTHGSGLAAHAAFALALRERLTVHEFDVLYAPFARAIPDPAGDA